MTRSLEELAVAMKSDPKSLTREEAKRVADRIVFEHNRRKESFLMVGSICFLEEEPEVESLDLVVPLSDDTDPDELGESYLAKGYNSYLLVEPGDALYKMAVTKRNDDFDSYMNN